MSTKYHKRRMATAWIGNLQIDTGWGVVQEEADGTEDPVAVFDAEADADRFIAAVAGLPPGPLPALDPTWVQSCAADNCANHPVTTARYWVEIVMNEDDPDATDEEHRKNLAEELQRAADANFFADLRYNAMNFAVTRRDVLHVAPPREPEPVPEKRTITIEIYGGCLTNVSGLPEGWDYKLVDWDDIEDSKKTKAMQATHDP
jgi:hypothetical protein